MKNNKGFAPLLILAIVAGILIVGGGAYYLGKSSTDIKEVKVEENNTIIQNNPVTIPKSETDTIVTTTTTKDCLPTTTSWIKVLSPNGGEVYQMGQTVIIKWKTCNAKTGQTVSLSIGNLIPPQENNGIAGGFNPSASFYPLQTANDGTETVTLGATSTNNKWLFVPGKNFQVSAVLNPLPTDTHETSYVQDNSDKVFTINSEVTAGNLIKLTGCGVSFIKTSDWSVISNTSNEIILDIPSADQTGGSGINIKCVLGNSITDTDAKFGNITYYYDSSSQKWMVNAPNEREGGTLPSVVATPLFTVDGWQVFRGTRRWLSYIVPISSSSILYLREGDTEGGSTKSLTNLVKTLKKL